MNRYTFVVQVHPEGISTLENLSTHERIPIADLDEIGRLIERWLEDLDPAGVRPRPVPPPLQP